MNKLGLSYRKTIGVKIKMDEINYKGDPRAVLCHFNEKHDNKGRFAKKNGSNASHEQLTNALHAPTLFDDDNSLKVRGASQDLISQTTDLVANKKFLGIPLSKIPSDARSLIGTKGEISSLVNLYMSNIPKSEYLNKTIGGSRRHNQEDYMKAGIGIATNIYQDYRIAALRSGWPINTVNKVFDEELLNDIAHEVGAQLGEYYSKQSVAPMSRKKTTSSGKSSPIVKREMISPDEIKKTYPDIPSAAVDAIYRSMMSDEKKETGIRDKSSIGSAIKHNSYIDPSSVLCHYNPNHNPQNGQFTSAGFGMAKYVDDKGRLTAAGKARLDYDIKRNAQKKKDDQIKGTDAEIAKKLTDPHRWVKEDLDAAQQGLQNAQNMAKALSEFEKKKLANRPMVRKKKLDLSEMSDKDLNDQINRYILEQRYQDIFNPKVQPEVSKGKKWLMNTLEIAGGALAVGASAVTIAKAIHDMKKGATTS